MGNWTRRAFLTTGIVAGGGLVGIGIRPGNQVDDLRHPVKGEGGKLVHPYVKIDTDNSITAIILTLKWVKERKLRWHRCWPKN